MEVSDQIQCNIDPDDPSKGQVIYTMNNNTEINRQARDAQDALDRAAEDAKKSKWNPKNWF